MDQIKNSITDVTPQTEQTEAPVVAPRPMVNPDQLAEEMQARMMWGVKRGVSAKDTETLTTLRGMNRHERRRFLSRNGRRVRAG